MAKQRKSGVLRSKRSSGRIHNLRTSASKQVRGDVRVIPGGSYESGKFPVLEDIKRKWNLVGSK